MQAGYREYMAIRDRLNLPLVETGALVVAWDEEQLAKLPAHRRAGASQRRRRRHADRPQRAAASASRILSARAPGRGPGPGRAHHRSLVGAARLRAPGPGAWRQHPAPLPRHRRRVRRRRWTLHTTRATSRAGVVINAAGNHGDLVEAIARESPFTHHAAQGPVRRVRQAGRRIWCTPSSCRCRPSAPRASWSAAPSSAICWSARPPRTRRSASAPRSIERRAASS